jgi:flagellar L-ring protein FlgH
MIFNPQARRIITGFGLAFGLTFAGVYQASADNLYQGQAFAAMASDRVASGLGDGLVIVVLQNAEARNSAANSADFRYGLEGSANVGSINEGLDLSIGRDTARRGEVRRSQSFATQLAVSVIEVYDNGDLKVAGSQQVRVNGQETSIRVTGRVRRADIQSDNRVLSTQVADATIDFDAAGDLPERQRRPILERVTAWFVGRE